MLKTLEERRICRTGGIVQGACLGGKLGIGPLEIRINFLRVRQGKRDRAVPATSPRLCGFTFTAQKE
jgi:hypothetical protein